MFHFDSTLFSPWFQIIPALVAVVAADADADAAHPAPHAPYGYTPAPPAYGYSPTPAPYHHEPAPYTPVAPYHHPEPYAPEPYAPAPYAPAPYAPAPAPYHVSLPISISFVNNYAWN